MTHIPATMTAMQLLGFGGPEMLQLAEVPVPTPAADEVLLKVGACGMNNTDLNLRKGWYSAGRGDGDYGWREGSSMQFPHIQGADIVGAVVAVGTHVEAARLGERVIVNPTIYTDHPENPLAIDFIGSERPGGYAEYVCVPATSAYAVNNKLTDAELATFATSYLTAEHMLSRAAVSAGDTVLITGASGGVGSALVQLVLARGATPIAIAGRGKTDHVRDLGAAYVLERNDPDLGAQLDQQHFTVVADVVGGPMFAALMEQVAAGGRLVTCGAIAGALVAIDLRTLYLRNLSLIGSTLGTASEFVQLIQYIEAGKIKPVLAATYPLRQLHDAQAAFEAKQFVGNIVIVP